MKKAYRKPELEQVKLVMEEAVLEGCKTGTGGGNNTAYPCQGAKSSPIGPIKACRGNSKS
ncbi:MAG: hypothetical protein C0617_07360 [Desulfuromonas sp.]|uniref:hypothetical protein n=1 Tax=Desulfuromonas sp. TaxID=892 RepID=UPI000CC7FEAC|nr:hypothetical protein [Desulfuromonas sp.]PLX84649.1 MAG: hypothetical protein C0617_07360 [Desulfuromonas sp.]